MRVHIDQRTGLPARYLGGLTESGDVPELAFTIPRMWEPTTWDQMSNDEQRAYRSKHPVV